MPLQLVAPKSTGTRSGWRWPSVAEILRRLAAFCWRTFIELILRPPWTAAPTSFRRPVTAGLLRPGGCNVTIQLVLPDLSGRRYLGLGLGDDAESFVVRVFAFAGLFPHLLASIELLLRAWHINLLGLQRVRGQDGDAIAQHLYKTPAHVV